MSEQPTNLPKYKLPQPLTAPFRTRSANPDGFDSKMKLWISAIEDWAVSNLRLTFSLRDIHKTFISESGVRPDKESIRLVLSEMKRRNLVAPFTSMKPSQFWTPSSSLSEGWVSWGVRALVSTLTGVQSQSYSDLTDLSITDDTKFVCQKSLHDLSHNLLAELTRIAKAEEQLCFEWTHLMEIINPIYATEKLDILFEYLEDNKLIATQTDSDTKLVKIGPDVTITQRDVATARLLRAKELLLASADRYLDQALRAKQAALECYNKKEIARAKSLLRSHKRFTEYAHQKEAQLTNVEVMLEQLENNDSNKIILQAYKDGANALKIANDKLLDESFMLEHISDDQFIEDTQLDETLLEEFLASELDKKLSALTVCHDEPKIDSDLGEDETELESEPRPARKPELSSARKLAATCE